MTREELEQIRRMLRDEVQRVVQPVIDDVNALKGTDKRHEQVFSNVTNRLSTHSGVQKDIVERVAKARESVSDVKLETHEEVTSAFRILEKKIDALATVPKAAAGSEAAAIAGATAAVQTKAVTSVVAQDTTSIIASQKTAQTWAWIRAVVISVVAPIIYAIVSALAHPGTTPQ